METSRSQSFFMDVRSRELNAFKVKKRPYFGDVASDFTEIGVVAVEHGGEETPPLSVSFCKTSKNAHIFAVSDEDGYVSLFNSRKEFQSLASHHENAEKSRISDWVAHQNAIFDLCWIKEDNNILTASGDQTIKLWDAQEKKCVGVLMGHTGSVKTLCSHPTNSDLLVSGSRDGSFAMWDLRCNTNSRSRRGEVCVVPSAVVKGAHSSAQAKRGRRHKAASMSITSVLYLKDELSIATAGAVSSIIKFWDTRNLKAQVTQAGPHLDSSPVKGRLHGVSSLSQDSNGVFLTASSMDNRIYLYNMLQLDKGPIQSFSGCCRIESFYVKSAISPDAANILSGSSDGNAYIWQVNKPEADPLLLKSHNGEVTAVDWCPSDSGKLVTSSDDFTVRLWNIESSYCSTSKYPSSVRRRVMALPSAERQELLMNEEPTVLTKDSSISLPFDKEIHQTNSSNPITMPMIITPEAQKRKFSLLSDLNQTFEENPEATSDSPSSVLNPPSSVKRKTIRDYFLVSP